MSRTSNFRWSRNTKHPYLRKIRTLAGGQTKGGFGAWVKRGSETEEKHEMFFIFCYFFSWLQRLSGLLILSALSAKTSCRVTSMMPKKLRKKRLWADVYHPTLLPCHFRLSWWYLSPSMFPLVWSINRLFVSITKPPTPPPPPTPATSTVRYRVRRRNY